MARHLAEERGVAVDDEALLCAAYLHDLGALGSYREPGAPHEVRAAALLDEIALPAGFPADRLPLVREIILGHDYRVKPESPHPEVAFFHDADVLDFLGAIGIARMISVVGLERWPPTCHPRWRSSGALPT